MCFYLLSYPLWIPLWNIQMPCLFCLSKIHARPDVECNINHLTYLKHTGAKANFLFRNYQEFDVWKMWFLWKMRFWNCEFCQKWDFEIVNFVENEILKLWILSKMRLWNCEFCEKWGFVIVNFVKNDSFKMWIFG